MSDKQLDPLDLVKHNSHRTGGAVRVGGTTYREAPYVEPNPVSRRTGLHAPPRAPSAQVVPHAPAAANGPQTLRVGPTGVILPPNSGLRR